MNMESVFTAIGIAAVYAVWPIIGKYSGASGAWISTLVVAGTFLTTGSFAFKEVVKSGMPTIKAVVLLIFIGLVNGVAVYCYSVKSADPNISTGAFVVLTTISMVVLAPFLDWIFNGNVISAKQWCGIAVAMLAVYLLKG